MGVLFITALIITADQISKSLVKSTMTLYDVIPVIPGFFQLNYITNKGMAFNQVKVYSHPDYIEYFKRGSAGTKSIKQDFWVRTTARNPNMKRVA